MKRFRFGSWRGLRAFAPILLSLVVGAYGCSSSGDEEEVGGPGGPGAFNFTEANMSTAAGIAIEGLEILRQFSQVTLALLDYLSGVGGVSSASFQPAAVIPIGDIGVCLGGGSAALTLNDADNNFQPSVGDSATLTFTDCDFEDDGNADSLDGTVTLAFTGLVLVPSLDVDADVSMNVTTTDDVGSQVITGSFGLSITSPDMVNYTAVFTAEDPDGYLKAREGGKTVKFGCFDILLTFSILDFEAGYFELSANDAVVNANGKIFSITRSGFPPLDFVPYPAQDNSYPDAGGMRFFSFVLAEGGCAAVGSPDGVGNSDGSNFILTALAGDLDDVTLQLRDSEDAIVSTETTTWSALAD
jgi:hypothetical protein